MVRAALSLILAASLVTASAAVAPASAAPAPAPDATAALAPGGTLRAAINFGNPVLATRDAASGEPRGVSVDLARELGRRLGVPVELVLYSAARAFLVEWVTSPVETPDKHDPGYAGRLRLWGELADVPVPEIAILAAKFHRE